MTVETNCGRCHQEAASGPARPSRRPPPRLAGHPPSAPAPAPAVRAQRVVFRLLLVAGQSSLVWTSVLCTFVPLGVDRSRFHASAMANNPAVNPHLCEPPFPLLWGARRGAELLGPVAVPGFALFRFIFFLSFGSSFPETPDVSPLIRSSLGRTPWDLAVSSGRLRGTPPPPKPRDAGDAAPRGTAGPSPVRSGAAGPAVSSDLSSVPLPFTVTWGHIGPHTAATAVHARLSRCPLHDALGMSPGKARPPACPSALSARRLGHRGSDEGSGHRNA